MSSHPLRAYDYVNRPYAVVREALATDPTLFRRATHAAASRADAVVASLRVEIAGVELGAGVDLVVTPEEETEKRMSLALSWKASKSAALFPSMKATLDVYPLSATETQLELRGLYTPPLGALGAAIDTLALHRIADASVHRFVSDVARLLREELPTR